MKMTKRFNQAYNALVKAYFNGTLAKGTCAACAVGNIVADAQGGEIDKDFKCNTRNAFWKFLFMTDLDTGVQHITDGDHYRYEEISLNELTNYGKLEMSKVEKAFELNTTIHHDDYYKRTEQDILEDQYKGLAAAVDVLLELDGLKDNGHKAKFREHPKLETA